MASALQTGVFLILIVLTIQIHGERILVFFSPPSPSHSFLGRSLAKGLADRGHNVTLLCPFSSKEAINYREIVLTGLAELFEDAKKDIVTNSDSQNAIAQLVSFNELVRALSEISLNNTNTQKLLRSNEKFDLMVLNTFLTESALGVAYHFNASVVLFCPLGASNFVNSYFNNPAPPAYVRDFSLDIPDQMNFWQRVQNTLFFLFSQIFTEYVRLPSQDKVLHTYFPDAPPLKKLMKDASFILLNSHPSISPPYPILPNMVEIGGFHLQEPKDLPQDLKNSLDKSENGFIYFSMGSNIKGTMLPEKTRKAFIQVFSKLPYLVLWKYEEDLPGLPKNVIIKKWLPQNDILAHPKIKLFITHGGFLSMTEAVYHGVPLVGVPVFGDQVTNMRNAEKLGLGKAITFSEVNEKVLMETILELLNDNSYAINIKERSKLLKDRPMKPIDTATFWIEYVLRNKNLNHFKNSSLNLEWYQIILLDVIGGVLLTLFTATVILYWITKKIYKKIFGKTKVVKSKKQKTS